jgi:tRNA(Leu) C34 or U34 (ribose-2'-O)-methylase TrmL
MIIKFTKKFRGFNLKKKIIKRGLDFHEITEIRTHKYLNIKAIEESWYTLFFTNIF